MLPVSKFPEAMMTLVLLPQMTGRRLLLCLRGNSEVTAGKKTRQTPVRSGSSPHLCLITLVPAGPFGAFRKQSRVPEPGVDARAPSGVEWHPVSQLSSRTEAPAIQMGPEKQKEALETGKYLQTLPPLLMKIMKDKARETGGAPMRWLAFWNSRVRTLTVPLRVIEAMHTTTVTPGADGEEHANAADNNFIKKYCLGFGVAIFVTMLMAMFSCYRLVQQRRQINQRLAEDAAVQHIARSNLTLGQTACSPQCAAQKRRGTNNRCLCSDNLPTSRRAPPERPLPGLTAVGLSCPQCSPRSPPAQAPWPLGSTSCPVAPIHLGHQHLFQGTGGTHLVWKLAVIGWHPNSSTLASTPPSCPPPPSFRGWQWLPQSVTRGQPLPQGSLRGLSASSTISALTLPSTIHQGMEATPAEYRPGDIIQQTDDHCLGEANWPSSPLSPPGTVTNFPSPSFRRLEQPPQGGSLRASSDTQKTTARGKHTRPHSSQPPTAPTLPSRSSPPSFRMWECPPPHGVGLGASCNTCKTSAWEKYDRPSSPKIPPAPPLSSCPSPPLVRGWEHHHWSTQQGLLSLTSLLHLLN